MSPHAQRLADLMNELGWPGLALLDKEAAFDCIIEALEELKRLRASKPTTRKRAKAAPKQPRTRARKGRKGTPP